MLMKNGKTCYNLYVIRVCHVRVHIVIASTPSADITSRRVGDSLETLRDHTLKTRSRNTCLERVSLVWWPLYSIIYATHCRQISP